MWSSSKLMVVVVFLNVCALLILSTSPAAAAAASTGDCSRVVKKKLFCQNYLNNSTTTPDSRRTRSCCDTLRKLNNSRDNSEVAKCLKQSSFAFPTSKAAQLLPGICNNLPSHKSPTPPPPAVKPPMIDPDQPSIGWPELVGMNGHAAAAMIEQHNSGFHAIVIPDGMAVTADLRGDRVRIYVNRDSGVVVRTPKIG